MAISKLLSALSLSLSATAGPSPCDSGACCPHAEACLQIVDGYFVQASRQQDSGLFQTYGPNSLGGGSCGELCALDEPCPGGAGHCRFDVYDNAVAAIYLTLRGKAPLARQILDRFTSLLYPAGDTLSMLPAAYEGDGGIVDGSVDTGDNAWVGMAFAHYCVTVGSECHCSVARDILQAISAYGCDDELRGFMGRSDQFYRSIEHNIDVYALARMVGDDTMAESAKHFVTSMYDSDRRVYQVGTGGGVRCDSSINGGTVAGDAQFWNLLADADQARDRRDATMAFVAEEKAAGGLWESDQDLIGKEGRGVGQTLQGVRFSEEGNGVQWEVTAGAVLGLQVYRETYQVADYDQKISLAKDSMRSLLQTYGSVPASVLGGNGAGAPHPAEFPGGSETGLGWSYFRYPHLTATAWAGLLFMGPHGNPFRLNGAMNAEVRHCVPPHASEQVV